MAPVTLERLAEGIRRANANGDVETVKKLGAVYRQMQGQDGPPPGAQPGSRAYADWALQQARSGKQLPQVSLKPPEVTDTYHDLGGNALAAGGSFIEGVPILGPSVLGVAQQARGAIQGLSPEQVQSEFDAVKQANPATALGANIAGSVAALAPLGATALGGRLLGTVGTTGERLIAGGLSGAALSGADTAARGGSGEDILRNTAIGAGLGMAFPAAGALKNKLASGAAQKAATSAAIADAPAASELKSAASQLFKAVDNSGVTVEPQAFGQMVVDLARKAKADRINPKLDPKAYATFEELGGVMGEVLNGRPLTLSELHTLRQIAQRAAVSSEGRDAMFANRIVDALDEFITKPGATTSPNGQAGNQLLEAISTWGRARRVSLIEDAMARAQNAASGQANGLRVEFRKLLNNPKTSKLFTAAERQAIENVVRGNPLSNLAKLAGMFGFNLGGSGSANVVGGSLGLMFGGPIGFAVGAGARKASEKLTEKAAERAAKIVATPNIPQLSPRALPPALIPPSVLPLEATKKRGPVEIRVPY